jgi:tetratricopeptide (TPR) repeat protein
MVKKKKEKRQPANLYYYFTISFLILFSCLLLLLNIFTSQTVSSLFYGVINNHYQSIVLFLKKIKNQSFFNQELKKYQLIYGRKIENDVFFEERERQEKIKKLEVLLQKNPDARDVLYQLYLLYQEAGNNKKAEEYYKKVKEIDPFLYNY